MAILPILAYPDPVLAQRCREIEQIDDELRTLAQDMAETMYKAPGIGLAAPQVGQPIRMVVVDTAKGESRGEPMCLINPVIVGREGETVFEEACLSVPDYSADVVRAAKVVVQATDLDGQPLTIDADGLQAICLQHELDHLDGVLFIDHISPLKRALYKKKRNKQLKREA